jgi:hypothetical protein
MAQGANNPEIARRLQLGQKTVRNYVSRLYRKFDLNNRSQLAAYLADTNMAPSANRSDLNADFEDSIAPTPVPDATDRR